jgi:hypothetical protein
MKELCFWDKLFLWLLTCMLCFAFVAGMRQLAMKDAYTLEASLDVQIKIMEMNKDRLEKLRRAPKGDGL